MNKQKNMNHRFITDIENLDSFQKLEVYMDYFIAKTSLKHDFDFINDKIVYLWKEGKIKSFEDFTSSKNIKVTIHGEDWQKQGYAQKVRVDFYGIYDFYQRIKL